MKFNVKKIIKICGNILMIVACVFIGIKLYGYKEQIPWEQIAARKGIVCWEIMGYALVMLISPVTYQMLVKITTNEKIPFVDVQYVCSKSNIYKYIPGNVFQYIGRNQLAVDKKLKHSEVAMATILEIMVIICSTIIVTLLLARENAVIWIEKYANTKWLILVIVALVCVIGIAAILFRKKLMSVWNKFSYLFTKKNFLKLSGACAWFALMLILDGVLFGFLFEIVGIKFTIGELKNVVGLFVLSFGIGYIMPGVPGGIGVREAVLIFFMGETIDSAALLTVTVLFRIISIAGDALAYVVVELFRVLQNRCITNRE